MIETKRLTIGSAFILAMMQVTTSALAADEPRKRDGFVMHLALGVGGLNVERSGSLGVGSTDVLVGDSTIAGGTVFFEATLGAMVSEHWAVVGTLFMQSLSEPKIERDGFPSQTLDDPFTFLMVGPGIEYVPDRRGPWTFGATAGLAVAGAKAPDNSVYDNIGGAGGGLSLHAGYAWWVAEKWSIGVGLRLSAASVHGEQTVLGITASEDDAVTSSALFLQANFL
jgi:hypothetical protein